MNPELGREVYRFDWNEYKYIYKDEIDPTTKQHYPKDYFMPDYAVVTQGQTQYNSNISQKGYIIIDGQRYFYRPLPGGEIELQKSR